MTPQHGCHRLLHAYLHGVYSALSIPYTHVIIACGFRMHVHEVVVAGSGCVPRPTIRNAGVYAPPLV